MALARVTMRAMSRMRILDAALLGALLAAMFWVSTFVPIGAWGYDALSYWPVNAVDPYHHVVWREAGAWVYAPPLIWFRTLSGLIPWDVFLAAWTVFLAGVLLALAPRRAALLFLLPPVALEIYYGNIHLLLAAAVVLGFRWPGTWAFVLLTKVTPGVGLAWFVARREWRALGIALGTTAVIAGVSFVLTPRLWQDWVDVLFASSGRETTWLGALLGPLWLRVVIAAVIAYVGGLAGLRWPVAVAVMLAVPALWNVTPSVLVALIPLVAMDRRDPLPARWPRRLRMTAPAGSPGSA
jgi:Glycosyltransferase family 87